MISVLLPTRNRVERCIKSIDSLINKANNLDQIEILLGLDNDDQTRFELIDHYKEHHFIIPHTFEPSGYKNLFKYYNALALSSKGDWLFVWNDDVTMDSQDWEPIIMKHDGQFALLAPYHPSHDKPRKGSVLFPILPRKWIELTGRVSGHCANDTWVEHISHDLGVFIPIPLYTTHDRSIRDETSINAVMPKDFKEPYYVNQREIDKRKIAKWLQLH